MAALISFYRTDKANDGEEILRFMKNASMEEVMKRRDYWLEDLEGMIPMVRECYDLIQNEGMGESYRIILGK